MMRKFTKLEDLTIMPWGKHKGKELHNVPASYLFWLEDEMVKKPMESRSSFHNGILMYIEDNRFELNLELKR